jgi:ATP-binding cassette subfamily C protein
METVTSRIVLQAQFVMSEISEMKGPSRMAQSAASTKTQALESPLRAALGACRKHFGNAALFSALLNLLMLAPTLYMLQVYDRVVPTRGVVTLIFLTGVFTLATLTLATLELARSRLLIRAGVRLDQILAPRVLKVLLARQVGPAERSSAVLREFDTLRQALSGPAVMALFDAPWTPLYIILCFVISPALGGLALFGSISLVALSWISESATRDAVKRSNEQAAISYASIDQSVAGAPVIQALGMDKAMVARHLAERSTSNQLAVDANFSGSTYIALTKFVRLMLQSLALGLGAWLAVEQKISAGGIFAASLMVGRALAPIETLVQTWRTLLQARMSYRSLDSLLSDEVSAQRPTALPRFKGELALEGVQVATPQRDRLILADISFSLAPGEALGIVGPSGAGKSTLIRAIAGAVPVFGGAIRFDGANAQDWDSSQLAAQIGYAPQEPTLFRGTVKENIARFRNHLEGDSAALDQAVVKAAEACGAHQMILRLPKAYDTELGWNGAGLSAGQAQRISLARALFGEPLLLILDEPNAHLDGLGESDLLHAIDATTARGATVIIAAHRTAVLRNVDKLLVVHSGRMAMFGPRQDVTMALNANAVVSPAVAAETGQKAPSEAPFHGTPRMNAA